MPPDDAQPHEGKEDPPREDTGDATSPIGSDDATVPLPQQLLSSLFSQRVGDRIGRYRLLQELGEGGFGVVYMAEQREPVRRKVALKVIKAGMDSKEIVARFEAERQALALMDHPHIARVLDAGATDTGYPYFVMELVKGIPITEFCDKNRLSTRERLELFRMVCSAVQHAHQKAIIHRDLKPSNILITVHDGKPVPKVIDFGIAKAIGQELTEKTLFTAFGKIVGTPQYMSPEQAEFSGLDIDTRSDIYSLGVLLYELLTGTTPITSESIRRAAVEEIARLIREVEPPKPSTRLSSLGQDAGAVTDRRGQPSEKLGRLLRGDLDWIVMKALEKDRTRRYETANDFAADVQRHLTDEPVLASPPSASYRLRKFGRKHRAALSAAATLFLVLLAGVTVSTWQAVRATRATRHAGRAEERSRLEMQRAVQSEDMARRERAKAVQIATRLSEEQGRQELLGGRPAAAMVYLAEALRMEPDSWSTRYLLGAAQRALGASTLLPYKGVIREAAFAANGSRLIALYKSGRLIVWDAVSRTPVYEVELASRTVDLHDLAIRSLGDDQHRLLVRHSEGFDLVDLQTGKVLLTKSHSPGFQIYGTGSFWPADSSLFCLPDGTYTIYDAVAGAAIASLSAGDTGGKSILHGNTGVFIDGIETIFLRYPHGVEGPFPRHAVQYALADVLDDSSRAITVCHQDGRARLWDLRSGKEILSIEPREGYITRAWLNDREHTILTESHTIAGMEDEIAMIDDEGLDYVAPSESPRWIRDDSNKAFDLWDNRDGRHIASLQPSGGRLIGVEISPSGRYIVGTEEQIRSNPRSYRTIINVWRASDGVALSTPVEDGWSVEDYSLTREGDLLLAGLYPSDLKAPWEDKPIADRLLHRVYDLESGLSVAEGTTVAALSPDGNMALLETDNEGFHLFDLTNRKSVASISGDWEDKPIAARLTSSLDALLHFDKSAEVWNYNDSQRLFSRSSRFREDALAATQVFGPDLARALTFTPTGIATLWRVDSPYPGNRTVTCPPNYERVRGLTFFRDDASLLFTGDSLLNRRDGDSIEVYKCEEKDDFRAEPAFSLAGTATQTSSRAIVEARAHNVRIRALPGSSSVVVIGDNASIHRWDSSSGSTTANVLYPGWQAWRRVGPSEASTSTNISAVWAAVSRDGSAAVAVEDWTVSEWERDRGASDSWTGIERHSFYIARSWDTDLGEDRGSVVLGDLIPFGLSWSPYSSAVLGKEREQFDALALALDSSGRRVLGTQKRGGTVAFLYDMQTARPIVGMERPPGARDVAIDGWLTLDGNHIATLHNDSTMHVWDTSSGRRLWSASGIVRGISEDGRMALLVDQNVPNIYDITSDRIHSRLGGGHTTRMMASFSSSNRLLVSYEPREHSEGLFPGGQRDASASPSHAMAAQIWDTTTGRLLEKIRPGYGIQNVTIHPDEIYLATTDGQQIDVWDLGVETDAVEAIEAWVGTYLPLRLENGILTRADSLPDGHGSLP